MSILTTLALMATAVVAKVRPSVNADVEITKLQAQVDDLERRLENLRGDVDGWMEIAQRWRARYEGRSNEAEILRAQAQAQQLMAMAQHQQAQYAQHQQALAQQNYFQGNPMGLGQALGSQAQALEWCNCVPARHDMFLRGD